MQISKILHTGLLCALSFITLAQNSPASLSGQVKTEDGEPLPGAAVGLKGTSVGTFANADGKYTLENVRPGSYQLAVSFLGINHSRKILLRKAGRVPGSILS